MTHCHSVYNLETYFPLGLDLTLTFEETICFCNAIQNKVFGCDKGGLVSKKGFRKILKIKLGSLGYFAGGPVVRNLPSHAGVWELGPGILRGSQACTP